MLLVSLTIFSSQALLAKKFKVITNIVKKFAALLTPHTLAKAIQAQTLLQCLETETAARSSK